VWPRLGFDPFVLMITALEKAEVIPGKHPNTRIKPLALANGHGRYMAVTGTPEQESCVRWGMPVKYIAAQVL
jgi:hypothetical protein